MKESEQNVYSEKTTNTEGIDTNIFISRWKYLQLIDEQQMIILVTENKFGRFR